MTIRTERIPREWDEPCRECKGTGTVHRRESFNLWTPEEHARMLADYGLPLEPLDPKHDVPANAYVCVAVGGANIIKACGEAVGLAREVKRPVVFVFNGAVAVAHADSDPTDVMKRWWKLAYGETYEQSAANR